jgi:hypothetical protein
MITKHSVKRLPAPAIVGEGAILRAEMPELGTRSATFRALNKACTVWHLSMADLHVSASPCGSSSLFAVSGMSICRRQCTRACPLSCCQVGCFSAGATLICSCYMTTGYC